MSIFQTELLAQGNALFFIVRVLLEWGMVVLTGVVLVRLAMRANRHTWKAVRDRHLRLECARWEHTKYCPPVIMYYLEKESVSAHFDYKLFRQFRSEMERIHSTDKDELAKQRTPFRKLLGRREWGLFAVTSFAFLLIVLLATSVPVRDWIEEGVFYFLPICVAIAILWKGLFQTILHFHIEEWSHRLHHYEESPIELDLLQPQSPQGKKIVEEWATRARQLPKPTDMLTELPFPYPGWSLHEWEKAQIKSEPKQNAKVIPLQKRTKPFTR